MKKILLILIIAIIISILVWWDIKSDNPTKDNNNNLTIAASIYPLAYFANEVAGNLPTIHGGLATVQVVTPNGVDPHGYEPSPKDISSIYEADLFILNGAGQTPWAEEMIDELRDRSVVVLNMATYAENIWFEDRDISATGNEEDEHTEANGNLNPHFWLDLELAQLQVELIKDRLSELDPENSDQYNNNANRFITVLQALDERYKVKLSTCANRNIIVSHKAFAYPAERYGINVISIAGISPVQEPTPQRMAELINITKEKNINYIFFETLSSPALSETIANETGAQTLVLNTIGGLTQDDWVRGVDYISLMEENLQNLMIAMDCQ
ncbi:metal ABC transporter solute-binding protein, Zn/Mn family [Patescibacteria group bacterium]